MNEPYIRNVIEAALLAAGRPLSLVKFAQLFTENSRPTVAELRSALARLAADYEDRGIELKETAAGFRIQVRRDLANEISRLWPERPARYSRALLETLALIAYRQPITRAEIEAVRGVAVNPNIIKTLLERAWVRVVGQRDVPGRPELLGTTKDFLDYFGLRTLEELPPLAELKAMGEVNLQLDLAKDAAVAGAVGTVDVDVVAEAGAGSVGGIADATGEADASSEAASTDADSESEKILAAAELEGTEARAPTESEEQEPADGSSESDEAEV